jgi:hypothetical protein
MLKFMKEKQVSTSQYPNDLLCRKLIVAGIPASEHSVESLTGKMPADLSGHSFQGMSVDAVAEVLLYFIAKGLVTLPVAVDKASSICLGVRTSASSTLAKKI